MRRVGTLRPENTMANSSSGPGDSIAPQVSPPPDGPGDRETSPPAFNIQNYLKVRAELVERALERAVANPGGPGSQLLEAMRYSLLAGGKRLRPIQAIAACEAVGGAPDDAMGLACALEMIHTYSLIHDD